MSHEPKEVLIQANFETSVWSRFDDPNSDQEKLIQISLLQS